jgi:hypothetical protein
MGITFLLPFLNFFVVLATSYLLIKTQVVTLKFNYAQKPLFAANYTDASRVNFRKNVVPAG